MGQIIELDQWRRRAQPAPASTDPLRWQAFPSTLVDAFLLPSITLWRCYAAACAGWGVSPSSSVLRPAETRGSASVRP